MLYVKMESLKSGSFLYIEATSNAFRKFEKEHCKCVLNLPLNELSS